MDLSESTEVRVALKVGQNVVLNLSNAETIPAGWKACSVDEGQTNRINMILDDEDTRDFPVGVLKAEVSADFADEAFADNVRTEKFGPMTLGAVEASTLS
ncbi:MAG: hypothetical protein AAF734_05055 [Bacteroidota bacterium]